MADKNDNNKKVPSDEKASRSESVQKRTLLDLIRNLFDDAKSCDSVVVSIDIRR